MDTKVPKGVARHISGFQHGAVVAFRRGDYCPQCDHPLEFHDYGPLNTCRNKVTRGEIKTLMYNCDCPYYNKVTLKMVADNSVEPDCKDSDFTPRPGNDTDHYRAASGHEAIDVIEAWNLNFNLGSALKYIARAGLKPSTDTNEDLTKALWYLNRETQRRKS